MRAAAAVVASKTESITQKANQSKPSQLRKILTSNSSRIWLATAAAATAAVLVFVLGF